jgi:nitrate reductase gamma subunit
MPASETILQILQGPMVWAALGAFAAGILVQTVRLARLTRKAEIQKAPFTADAARSMPERREEWIRRLARMKTTALGASPVLSSVSILFHVCLFITPVFLMGHNILIRAGTGLRIPSFPQPVSDTLTLAVLLCGVFFLLRRLFLKRVRVITTPWDIFLLLIVLLPFATGILAHHQLLAGYRAMMILHMAAGELVLIMIPFSKFFHMIFFFFGRFSIVSEYSLGRPKRIWRF